MMRKGQAAGSTWCQGTQRPVATLWGRKAGMVPIEEEAAVTRSRATGPPGPGGGVGRGRDPWLTGFVWYYPVHPLGSIKICVYPNPDFAVARKRDGEQGVDPFPDYK